MPDSRVWDFWLADDGKHYDLYFLSASRALHHPEIRHFRAAIGHAVPAHLTWLRVEDAVVHGVPGNVDDRATWTDCTVQHPKGTWPARGHVWARPLRPCLGTPSAA